MIHGKRSNVVRVGLLGPVDLNPRESQDFLSDLVLDLIYEAPYAPPFPGKSPEPLIFCKGLERVHKVDGPDEFSAAVHEGRTFSDGTPLEPRHVVESLARTRSFREHAKISLEGDRVKFVLYRPNARFDLFLTQRFCSIALDRGSQLIGTGPYKIASESRPEETRLVRNPHYRPEPEIEEIVFRAFRPDEDGRPRRLVEALKNGEVDLTNVMSRQDLRQLRGLRTWFEAGNSTAILFFNTERPFLSDQRVRKALALAVDRKKMTGLFYDNPLAFTATGLLPPAMGQWPDRIYPNPEGASAQLVASGQKIPGHLEMLVMWSPRPYLPQPRVAAEHLAARWKKLGLQVDIKLPGSYADYLQRVRHGSYDLALSGWVADTPDPADFLDSTLASRMVPRTGEPVASRANLSRWRSAAMDRALDGFRSEGGARQKNEILRLLHEDVPLFPLSFGSIAGVHTWRIKNFQLSPLGYPMFARMRLAG